MRYRVLSALSFRCAFFAGACLLLFFQTAWGQTPEKVWADTLRAQRLLDDSKQLSVQGHSPEALEKARQALDVYKTLYGGNHTKTARAAMFVGRELRNQYRTSEAAALFERSFYTFQMERDTPWMSRCQYHLSLCFRNLGRFDEAENTLHVAIALLLPDSTRQASLLTDYRFTLGTALIDRKNYLAAVPLLEAANVYYVQSNNLRYQGIAGYHLGAAYFGLRDYERAKEHYLGAQANLAGVLEPDHPYFADLQIEIGKCYAKTGEPETARKYLEAGQTAYQQYHPDDPHLALIMQDLGDFYLENKQYAAAVEQLERCLAEKEKRFSVQPHYLLNTLQSLGVAYGRTGDANRADRCFRRGLRIATDSVDNGRRFIWPLYTRLAERHLEQGDFTACLSLCDSAFLMAGFDGRNTEKILPRDHFRALCHLAARAWMGRYGQSGETAWLAAAESWFARAAETLYREVEEISVHSSREILFDRDYTVLEEWLDAELTLFEVLNTPEHAEKAFRIAAQSKAFLLAGAMRRSGALRYAGVPDSVLQTELRLRESIAAAEKILESPVRQKEISPDSLTLSAARDLTAWRTDYHTLLERIARDYPEYYRLRTLQRLPSPAKVRQVLAPGQALLLYGKAGPRLCAFVLSPDTLRIKRLPAGVASDEALEQFRASLTAYHTAAEPDDAAYERDMERAVRLGQSLYQDLLSPVDAWLPERVVVIPEGKLCYLPFEALLSSVPADAGNWRTYPFWAKEKAISYALSTDYLEETTLSPARKAIKNWLGLAPFAEGDAKTVAQRSDGGNPGLTPLPSSGKEVADIAALMAGEAWLGAAAAPGRFLKAAAFYRFLHLATHARADDRQGDYSWLAVAGTGERIAAKDLYQLSLAAEMVVLSACEAGGGSLLRGEGIIGLVRAFSFAGARSVVASLWAVNDQSTADLMLHFYQNLKAGQPRDVALKKARLHLLNDAPQTAHPFFWAGFRVYGNVGKVF